MHSEELQLVSKQAEENLQYQRVSGLRIDAQLIFNIINYTIYVCVLTFVNIKLVENCFHFGTEYNVQKVSRCLNGNSMLL